MSDLGEWAEYAAEIESMRYDSPAKSPYRRALAKDPDFNRKRWARIKSDPEKLEKRREYLRRWRAEHPDCYAECWRRLKADPDRHARQIEANRRYRERKKASSMI